MVERGLGEEGFLAMGLPVMLSSFLSRPGSQVGQHLKIKIIASLF